MNEEKELVETNKDSIEESIKKETDESGMDESGMDESGMDESGMDESGMDESGKDESGKDESGMDESGKDESGKDESGKDESGKDESGKDESGKDESGKDESGKDESGKDESGKDESGKDESGKDESGKDESGKDESGKDESGKDESGKDESGKDESGKDTIPHNKVVASNETGIDQSGNSGDLLRKLKSINSEIKQLISRQDPVASNREFKNLAIRWDSLTKETVVTDSELEKKYWALSGEFNKNLEWALWANYKKKEEICENLEKNIENCKDKELYDKFELLKKEWKKTGNVPLEKSKELGERYRDLCQKIYDKNSIYFEKNLSVKQALCEKIEVLKEPDHWQKASEFVKEAQRNWNGLGPVPRKDSDEIWKRFQAACNTFFSFQKEYFKDLKKRQKDNLIKKRELCVQVEGFQNSTDWKVTSTKIHDIQKNWKSIGSAGKKYENKLWVRFKSACDTFFSKQKGYFDNLDNQRPENLQKKEDLCRVVEEMDGLPDDEKYNLIIKTQKQWKEIGPVPRENEQSLWERFRKPIDFYFNVRKEKYENEKKSYDDNLTKKESLCTQAEELQNSSDWDDTKEKLKALQKQWNEIGRVPRAKENEVWGRFKRACDTFFSRLKGHREDRRHSLQDNLKKKIDLCFQAEIIAGIEVEGDDEKAKWQLEKLSENFWFKIIEDDTWESKADKLKELQREWKQIGPVPRNRSQELWDRFRNACNHFFEDRSR